MLVALMCLFSKFLRDQSNFRFDLFGKSWFNFISKNYSQEKTLIDESKILEIYFYNRITISSHPVQFCEKPVTS